MNSKDIGNIGEAAALKAFMQRNIPVLMPFGDNLHYDLVIEWKGTFKRIQVKTCEKLQEDGTMMVKTKMESNYVSASYNSEIIDYIFLYCVQADISCLIPVADKIPSSIRIHFAPPKNNQHKGIRMFQDYEIDKVLNIN